MRAPSGSVLRILPACTHGAISRWPAGTRPRTRAPAGPSFAQRHHACLSAPSSSSPPPCLCLSVSFPLSLCLVARAACLRPHFAHGPSVRKTATGFVLMHLGCGLHSKAKNCTAAGQSAAIASASGAGVGRAAGSKPGPPPCANQFSVSIKTAPGLLGPWTNSTRVLLSSGGREPAWFQRRCGLLRRHRTTLLAFCGAPGRLHIARVTPHARALQHLHFARALQGHRLIMPSPMHPARCRGKAFTNPAPFIHPNGTVLCAYRANGNKSATGEDSGEHVSVAVGASINGPFVDSRPVFRGSVVGRPVACVQVRAAPVAIFM